MDLNDERSDMKASQCGRHQGAARQVLAEAARTLVAQHGSATLHQLAEHAGLSRSVARQTLRNMVTAGELVVQPSSEGRASARYALRDENDAGSTGRETLAMLTSIVRSWVRAET